MEKTQADNYQWRHQLKEWQQYPATPTETLFLNKRSQILVDKNGIAFIVRLCLNFNVCCLSVCEGSTLTLHQSTF